MTPTKKKRLTRTRPKAVESAALVEKWRSEDGEKQTEALRRSVESTPKMCGTCFAHCDFPKGIQGAHPDKTRCALNPDWTQRSKYHWCVQWKPMKE